jgi:hypothetical protein
MTKITDKTDRIRRLNDLARTQPQIVNATWVLTQGVNHLVMGDGERTEPVRPEALARAAMLRKTIAEFATWEPGSDPYSEHDFGAFDLFGERIFFKVDYYHPDHDTHAPDRASIELCRRVLTIMLADEY